MNTTDRILGAGAIAFWIGVCLVLIVQAWRNR